MFYHGGNLSVINENYQYKKGKFEYGAGLYLTTSYDVAEKYTKGSRKLYLIEIEKGNNLDGSLLPYDKTIEFIKGITSKVNFNLFLNRIKNYVSDGKINAYNFEVIILNNNIVPAKYMNDLRRFYVENNIDYSIHHNSFGFGEKMVVLYNFKLIKSKTIIK